MSLPEAFYTSRPGKPRSTGLTIAADYLMGLNRGDLSAVAEYVDVVKIGWGLPLLLDKSTLAERIGFYHNLGVKVSTGGTLLEIAVRRQAVKKVFDLVRAVGFDMVEISEGVVDLSFQQKAELVEHANRHGLEYLIEVGKKEPGKQLTVTETSAKIREALQLKSSKVVLEGGEDGVGVGMYDSNGRISWDWVNQVVGSFGPPILILEAPLDSQQAAFVLEFGPEVSLGNVPLTGILKLELLRRGLRGETLGLERPHKRLEGSPAAKFIYYLISSERSLDQSQLIERSGLPRRTVQAAIDYLRREGFVREVPDLTDSRRRRYTIA